MAAGSPSTCGTLIADNGISVLSPGFTGELLRPGDDGFDDAAAIWNGSIVSEPALIARCRSAQDVVASVRFAADNRVPVAVRGGGHNVAGTATCDDGLVIDLTHMNEIVVDPAARLVRAGGGATWADVDAATQLHRLAVPGGLVSRTGIAGLTLGGGLGWLRRKHGLSCDNLVSVEIVTADGKIRTASDVENQDLFWAVRGGGGNFGVVTQFTYRAHPMGPTVAFCFVFYPLEIGRSVLKGWRTFCNGAADEACSIALCGTVPHEEPFPQSTRGRQFVAIAAVHCGPVEEGQRALEPLRHLGTPLCDLSAPMPYVDVQSAFDADYPNGRRYYWKSLFLERLDDAAVEVVLQLAAQRPSSLSTVDIWQLGGAMSRVAPEATAFGNRNAPWLLGIESNWIDQQFDDCNKNWAGDACARMESFSNGASYVNFEPDTDVGPQARDAHRLRLAKLKRCYDPENLFRLNHNIAPYQGESNPIRLHKRPDQSCNLAREQSSSSNKTGRSRSA
ncbi:MAG: FAD-binding oxidoreductase [Hyphomicrobiales bacterium]|nr:FAD-binding oxidoreductase [Hyphomicrobiales bacterium]